MVTKAGAMVTQVHAMVTETGAMITEARFQVLQRACNECVLELGHIESPTCISIATFSAWGHHKAVSNLRKNFAIRFIIWCDGVI